MRGATLVTAATASYIANCALGLGAATRLVDTSSVHWLHHALYVSTATLTAAAASTSLWSGRKAGWLLLPAAVPLGLIPYASTSTRRHVTVALLAAPFFAASTIKAWSSH